MRRLLCLVLIASCTPHAPKPAPTAVVVVGSVGSTALTVTPPPAPAIPAGVDPVRAEVAQAMCSAAYDPETKEVGCPSHPPFAPLPARAPITKWEGEPTTLCRIDALTPGAYSRAGADELLVSFAPCAIDDVWDSGFPGSAVLLERTGASWRTVADVGAGVRGCLKAPVDGRTVLLCTSNLMTGSTGDVHFVYRVDFARKDRPAVTLARVFGEDVCMKLTGPYGLDDGFTRLVVHDLVMNGSELTLAIDRTHAAPAPGLAARATAQCAHDKSPTRGIGTTASATLVFPASAQFAPSPATAALLKKWTAESPEGMHGLDKVGPPDL